MGASVSLRLSSSTQNGIEPDFAAIPDEDWDAFIRSISSFADWKSMLNEAGKEWAAQKLDLK